MTIPLRHDRIYPLCDLSSYPGSDFLDMTVSLPWSTDPMRRVWLMTAQSSPVVSIDDATLEPQRVCKGEPRWIDYGVAELPIIDKPYDYTTSESHKLRVRRLSVAECVSAYLVVTVQRDRRLDGCSLEEAERKLWGLARRDAGATTLSPNRVQVGKGVTFRVTYTAGPRGLPSGALVHFNVPSLLSTPQVEDNGAAGHVAVDAADCPVSIVSIATSVESHEKTDIICRLEEELPASRGFALTYRTDSMYIFPSRAFRETDRKHWWSYLAPLAAAVAVGEGAQFVSLLEDHGHALETVPGPSERLHLFLPGRRYCGEELSVRGTFTDHYRNAPPRGPIDTDIALWLESDTGRTQLGSLEARMVARHRFAVPLPRLGPGVYRVIARRPGSDDEVARSNPLELVEESSGQERVYWGEIHSHSEMSDGSGDFRDAYRYVRDQGALEFASISDHAECVTDNQWQWMQDVTNSFNRPGEFVTLVGYEHGGVEEDRCIYTSRSRIPMFRGNYAPTNSLGVVWGHFHGDEDVVGGPHATMVHHTVWEEHDPEVERFAEIYSMWGASDFRGGPLYASWMEPDRVITVNEILQSGAKLGFTGGGDCHEAHGGFSSEDPEGQGRTPHTFNHVILYRSGLTAAVMPCLDRGPLIRAIRNRRTYATTGARILLDFTVSGLPMGAVGEANEVVCRAAIHAVDRLSHVEVVKNGDVAWTKEIAGLDVQVSWRDPQPGRGEHYYYLHVVQENGQEAWASPVWLQSGGRG